MILRIVLCLSCGMLVSSNNGYPIMPAQTYPIYQQNGYSNPPANQPSDIASYLQNIMAQNQSPTLDLSPSSIRQLLLNRILSGQSAQASFNQNSRDYGSNLVEFPNNAIGPNALNSYFAAPTANIQPTGVINNDRTEDTETNEKRKNKKRRSKPSTQHENSENSHKRTNKPKVNDLHESDRGTSKKPKRRSRKPKTEDSHDNQVKNNQNEDDKKTKKKKRKHKEDEVTNPVDEENKETKPRRRHKKKPKSDKDNAEKLDSEQTTNKPKQIQEGINVAHFNEGIVQENRFVRNPIPEGGDLFKSIPNIPENIANSFKGIPQFNNPAMSSFFANFENIYQTMLANNKGANEHIEIKRRPPTRNKINTRKKIEVKTKNSTTTEAAVPKKPIVTPKVNVVPKEIIIIKEKPRANVDPIPTEAEEKAEETIFFDESEANIVNETSHELENMEIKDMETIDEPVNNYEGYIDDYYPQFTDSAAYTANNREVFVKNLKDAKYFYAVDKTNPEIIKKMRFESFGLPQRIIKENDINKKYDDTEKEAFKKKNKPDSNDEKEIIQFRSPPHLEIPDFQTRKVEWSEISPRHSDDGYDDFDPRYLENKASYYSENKIPHFPGIKENSKKIQKEKPKDVEMVFARSKVATYGPVYNPEGEDSFSAASSHQVLTNDSHFKDGGTTYVLASSLDHPAML